jgi:hypothetical protein
LRNDKIANHENLMKYELFEIDLYCWGGVYKVMLFFGDIIDDGESVVLK